MVLCIIMWLLYIHNKIEPIWTIIYSKRRADQELSIGTNFIQDIIEISGASALPSLYINNNNIGNNHITYFICVCLILFCCYIAFILSFHSMQCGVPCYSDYSTPNYICLILCCYCCEIGVFYRKGHGRQSLLIL